MYRAIFSSRAEKFFKRIPKDYQKSIKEKIVKLEINPYLAGTIKLLGYPVASCRRRVGDYRIFI